LEKNVTSASKKGLWKGLGRVVKNSVQTRALVLPVDIKLVVERITKDTQAIILTNCKINSVGELFVAIN